MAPTNERTSERRRRRRQDVSCSTCPPARPAERRSPSLPFPESNKSTKEFNWTATAAPAQDEVSGRTITPNVGVSFVIRQSNIPGAKHCIDARPPPPTSPGQPRLFLSRMLRRSVVAAVAASLGPPASLPLALLSQPSPETPVKRIGMDGPSVRRGIVRMAIATRQ